MDRIIKLMKASAATAFLCAIAVVLLLAACDAPDSELKTKIKSFVDQYDWKQTGSPLTAEANAATSAQFGYSVGVSGDWAIVGAYGENGSQGAVYFFKRNGDSWERKYRFTLDTPVNFDCFGYAVAIDGNFAIISAYGRSDGTPSKSHCGAIYIYTLNQGAWSSMQKLSFLNNEPDANDQAGDSVAISGNYAVVGCILDTPSGKHSHQGCAYVFHFNGSSWSQQEKITSSDFYSKNDENFGGAVSISGDCVAVGVPFSDINTYTQAGRVFIFSRNDIYWGDVNKNENWMIESDIPTTNDWFGYSVALSGNSLLIGSPNLTGYAMIFEKDSKNNWNGHRLFVVGKKTGDNFGWSASITGNYAIVGASTDDDILNNSGAVYIFEKTGNTWQNGNKKKANIPNTDDYFGYSVSISLDHLIVGSYMYDDSTHTDAGAAYIFTRYQIK
jgi:hypothetical protein